jgi:uncharacterized protein (DUF488 family)
MGVARGEDVLDITRKGADPVGVIFAPSDALLIPILAARKRQRRLFATCFDTPRAQLVEEARAIEEEAWAWYVPRYLDEMRASYRRQRRAWDALLARERVCLVCFCPKAERCHRTVLATQILPRLGATFVREIEREKRQVELPTAPHT